MTESTVFDFTDLNDETRALMVAEFERDTAGPGVFLGSRLTNDGRAGHPALLREALVLHDPVWLAAELRRRGWIALYESRET